MFGSYIQRDMVAAISSSWFDGHQQSHSTSRAWRRAQCGVRDLER